jgi:hypothetical protein
MAISISAFHHLITQIIEFLCLFDSPLTFIENTC